MERASSIISLRGRGRGAAAAADADARVPRRVRESRASRLDDEGCSTTSRRRIRARDQTDSRMMTASAR
eukprot:29555-Pelagococcus_subviridis.AAC.4